MGTTPSKGTSKDTPSKPPAIKRGRLSSPGSPSGPLGSPSGSPSGSRVRRAPRAPRARATGLPLPNFSQGASETPINPKRMIGAAGSVVKAPPENKRPIIVFDFDGVLSPANFVSPMEAIDTMIFEKEDVNAKAAMDDIAFRLLELNSKYDLYICSQNYIKNLKKYKDFFHIKEERIIGAEDLNGSVDKGLEVGILCNSTTGAVYFFDDDQGEVDGVRATGAFARKVDAWDGTGDPDILEELKLLEAPVGTPARLDFGPNLRF